MPNIAYRALTASGERVSGELEAADVATAIARLQAVCSLVLFDALRVKVRDEGTVRNQLICFGLGVGPTAARRSWACGASRPPQRARRTATSLTERAEFSGAKFWRRARCEAPVRSPSS